jgi:hypothetical protein
MADEALPRYAPPAFMTDFDGIPGQLQAWSDAVSGWFDEVVAQEQEAVGPGNRVQYYNELTTPQPGPKIDAEIIWNAFPKTLRMVFGDRAYAVAEQLFPLTHNTMPGSPPFFQGPGWDQLQYRPLDEYCEFRVVRDDAGKIVRVLFTSEPPEYWQALHGDTLADYDGNPKYRIPGDPKKLLALYRELVDPAVQLEDLVCATDFVDYSDPANPAVIYPKGSYNPYNKWNSTHGIAHLAQPNNSLSAEIKLGGDATVLRGDAQHNPVTLPEALCCCSRYGGPNRTSDPTIGSTVNDVARWGAYVTIKDPVGLYMDSIDLAGFETPRGRPIDEEFFTIVRGRPGMAERAVFEVPKKMKFTVGDLRVGGVPLRFGGQIAERIKVKLVGQASGLGTFSNAPQPCVGKCCVDATYPRLLDRAIAIDRPCPPGSPAAFAWGGTPQAKEGPLSLRVEAAVSPVAARRFHPGARHRTR